MERKIEKTVTGFSTVDGAGVNLVRVLGRETVEDFDPILMLDSFDSQNPEDYTAGFPLHPHRGIETISYVYKGKMVHKDSLGNKDAIGDGEIQWMNSGSGILHEEMIPEADRLLGVQLWLNLPQKDKMSKPSYHSIGREEIPEIPLDGGKLRLLAGKYKDYEGYKGDYLPLNYYDIHLEPNQSLTLHMDSENSVMCFTLLGKAKIGDVEVKEKTAVKLSEGDSVTISATEEKAQILYMESKALHESVAWAGPIVMNTEEEIQQAYSDLKNETFIKDHPDYE
ncbi:pirin family protein [Peptoniphilus sp. KCTC 25270]|uniref:pirin family protein n=1 Tax=Peptoniphilus sp. KCTC 25270 TaxID=2897414 RepID=UPI001E563320|nr:pirin family protein [Peptoniphilus sp. KCTC 25270]MCD1147478.1 pirin family protein [Peptoniphilus sp. KCTC 25270]